MSESPSAEIGSKILKGFKVSGYALLILGIFDSTHKVGMEDQRRGEIGKEPIDMTTLDGIRDTTRIVFYNCLLNRSGQVINYFHSTSQEDSDKGAGGLRKKPFTPRK